jgi:hypothetical protein
MITESDLAQLKELVELAEKATPGVWKTRGGEKAGPTASLPMFVQAPRLHQDDPYDIEVLGDDRNDELYPPELAENDCRFIAAAHNAIPALRALLAEHAIPEWQPIETAPKDGTWVVLLIPESIQCRDRPKPWVETAQWEKETREWWEQVSETRQEKRSEDCSHWSCWEDPTHWMPLPEAPLAAAKETK